MSEWAHAYNYSEKAYYNKKIKKYKSLNNKLFKQYQASHNSVLKYIPKLLIGFNNIYSKKKQLLKLNISKNVDYISGKYSEITNEKTSILFNKNKNEFEMCYKLNNEVILFTYKRNIYFKKGNTLYKVNKTFYNYKESPLFCNFKFVFDRNKFDRGFNLRPYAASEINFEGIFPVIKKTVFTGFIDKKGQYNFIKISPHNPFGYATFAFTLKQNILNSIKFSSAASFESIQFSELSFKKSDESSLPLYKIDKSKENIIIVNYPLEQKYTQALNLVKFRLKSNQEQNNVKKIKYELLKIYIKIQKGVIQGAISDYSFLIKKYSKDSENDEYLKRRVSFCHSARIVLSANSKVEGALSINVNLKLAYPLTNVRTPDYKATTEQNQLAQGLYKALYEIPQAKLDKDFVFYYKFKDNLPGRIEVIPYRSADNKDGSFMLVVTPGLDLKPLSKGADYIFVLDTSGSMEGKIAMLCKGVNKSLTKMQQYDRFRIITFNTYAKEITSGWTTATVKNVKQWTQHVNQIQANGSTNMYDALKLCLSNIKNDDRATSVILVTDAVTNTGVVNPKAFHELMKKYDIRVFGFVMGNSANWPLMRLVCNASGGFYSNVSNNDDIIGQILKAKNKINYECLHDAKLKISGVKVYGLTNLNIGKIYRGQQLVIFGKYKKDGKARVTLKARLTGKDKTYSTVFNFPKIDTDNPEIERLWALNQIEMTEDLMNTGRLGEEKGKARIRKLGLDYQLVTDETSMIVLSDQSFSKHGIERHNKQRTAIEHKAQERRAKKSVRNYSVDKSKPAFKHRTPSFKLGGGAIDPFTSLISLGVGVLTFAAYRRKKNRNKQ